MHRVGDFKFNDGAPARADLRSSLATAYEATGALEKGAAALQEALQAQPGFTPAVLLQVRLKLRAGDALDALQMLDELLESDAKLVEAWRLKGDVVLGSSKSGAAGAKGKNFSFGVAAYRHAKAIEAQNQAHDLQPENHEMRMRLAKLYLASGDKSKAGSELQRPTKAVKQYGGQAEVQQLLRAL